MTLGVDGLAEARGAAAAAFARVPGLAALFHFAPCPPASLALAAAAGAGAALAVDLLKPQPMVSRAVGASARA